MAAHFHCLRLTIKRTLPVTVGPSARFSEGWQGVAGLTDDFEELMIQEAQRVRGGM